VTWPKVLLLPSHDRIHGGEGWVNERYLAPAPSELPMAKHETG